MQLWWLDITLLFLSTWEDSFLCQENVQTRPEAKVELIRIQISSLWLTSVLPLLLHKQNESHLIMLETVPALSFLLLVSSWKLATVMDTVNRQVQTRRDQGSSQSSQEIWKSFDLLLYPNHLNIKPSNNSITRKPSFCLSVSSNHLYIPLQPSEISCSCYFFIACFSLLNCRLALLVPLSDRISTQWV